jgi:hypothetical protein
MTVEELIEKLKEFDPQTRVVVDGYEDGFDEPKVKEEEVVIDANWDGQKKPTHWCGRHDWGDHSTAPNTPVVVVGR